MRIARPAIAVTALGLAGEDEKSVDIFAAPTFNDGDIFYGDPSSEHR